MIDTHCHLTDPRLGAQLDAVIERAQSAGVSRLITIGTGIADSRAAIELCRKRPNVFCCVGIHPHYVGDANLGDMDALRTIQSDPSVFGLGEMGLDYHYDFAPRGRQKDFFAAQLQLARELDRAVVIHCREAVEDTLAIMKKFAPIKAVFHCFTGTIDEARQILDHGYLLGFTGPVTYKKSEDLREVVRLTPLDQMLLETDAPYLSPEPVRKIKTNEPAFVMHTAQRVAELKQVDVETLGARILENAQRLFGRSF